MRIKIDDKIYRLKEIESGVDSLMELVEEYKDGDFLHSDWENENITIIYRKRNGSHLYYHASKSNGGWLSFKKDAYWPNNGDFRLATESEKKELIDALAEVGKQWNAEKMVVEDIPVYKDGDFVVKGSGSILIFKEARDGLVFDHAYLHEYGELIIDKVGSYDVIKRHAATKEKQRMIDALTERGKRWNKDKKCVEDIPKRKFKAGDKVKIKDGISSETHRYVSPNFTEPMDEFIGKELTVKEYSSSGFVVFYGDYFEFHFHENWLEPWSDEPKVGDWVVAWDDDAPPVAGILDKIHDRCFKFRYSVGGMDWQNIIKFDGTKEHLEKVRKG